MELKGDKSEIFSIDLSVNDEMDNTYGYLEHPNNTQIDLNGKSNGGSITLREHNMKMD